MSDEGLLRFGHGEFRISYLQDTVFIGSLHEIHGRGSDKRGDKGIGRVVVNRMGRVDLLYLSLVHHGNPGGYGHGFDLVMGHINHRRLKHFMQLYQFRPRFLPQPGVQVA